MENKPTINDVIYALGKEMARLSPGDLARLRRTADSPLRAPHYWRWKSRYGWPDRQDDDWACIIAFMAIITPKGRDKDKKSPHNKETRLGKTLCDGGEAAWPSSTPPRPKVSETRLARLLNARGQTRRDAVLRLARLLARNNVSVNCADLAWFLLNDKTDASAQAIARAYYARLDHAARNDTQD